MILSALGEREVEGGGKAKLSDQERTQIRRQALGVWIRSITTGVVCAALIWLLVSRASAGWRVASGEWRVASGEWRVASGEWRVASDE